jgi:arylsulfatase A-like enzyme
LAVALLVAVVTFGIAADAALALHAPGRPNILLIMTDDQRAEGTMAVLPQTRSWFETGGTKFTRAFATTPSCCPSRASVFSGRYVHNHGVRTNNSAEALDQRFTIQEYLRQSGYRTGYFGKYFNAWDLFRSPASYDDWSISVSGYSPFRVNENGVVKTISQYATSYFKDNAVRFIQESESQDATPWFLQVAPTAPHSPFTPDEQYANAPVPPFDQPPNYLEADKRDKPVGVASQNSDPASIESTRVAQLRTLMSVDDLVGEVLSTLQATGEDSSTLAIFMSDNGFEWGEHGLYSKGDVYDASVRIPMYLRWPGHVVEGATDPRLVANVDVAPTIADAVGGLGVVLPMDGHTMLNAAQSRSRLLLESYGGGTGLGWASLRTPASYYVEHYDPVDNQSIRFREYYDLTADPWEMDNLLGDGNAANDPSTAGLSAQLAADRGCAGAGCP